MQDDPGKLCTARTRPNGSVQGAGGRGAGPICRRPVRLRLRERQTHANGQQGDQNARLGGVQGEGVLGGSRGGLCCW